MRSRNLGAVIATPVIVLSIALTLTPAAFAEEDSNATTLPTFEQVDFAVAQGVKKVSVPFDVPENLDSIGKASVKQQLVMNNDNFELLPTFDSPDKALQNVKGQASNALGLLEGTFDLDELSDSNWKDYQEALEAMLDREDCPEWYSEENDELWILRTFFDIYENDEDNAEILKCASCLAEAKKLHVKDEELRLSQDLADLLPDQGVLQRDNEKEAPHNEVAYAAKASGTYNATKAIAYAKKHATSINNHVYAYFKNGDCTNFASQILEQAGVKQVSNTSVYKGWWHKRKILPRSIVSHTHSRSWTVADTFCRYMGVGYKTKNHAAFSQKIKAGDFIAADWSSDGKYDHVGFVAGKGRKTAQGYYDYLVAQHTSNYLRWASSSSNGWDNTTKKGGTLARIRR